MVKFRDAEVAYKLLNGVICVYKPPCVPVKQVIHTIITNLCRDLNALPARPIEQRVEILGATNAPMTVKLVPNYADDPLACGPRYIHEDFRCTWATHLGLFSSGVMLLGINEGTKLAYKLNKSRLTRAFKIHGQLGKATDTHFWNGRTMERSTYNHVTRDKIDRIVAHMQSSHQKTVYEMTGLHMESQTLYDLAAQGPIRPTDGKLPVLYGIKCVHYKPPDFTLEIQSINAYDKYFWTLCHDLGTQLKTSAHCTGVQCLRQGKFGVDLALLRKHWQLGHVLDNVESCRALVEECGELVRPESARLNAKWTPWWDSEAALAHAAPVCDQCRLAGLRGRRASRARGP